MPPVRWDTVQVDGKPMRVYLGVPDGKPHEFQNFLDATRYRERASRGSWGEMLAFFAQHLKL